MEANKQADNRFKRTLYVKTKDNMYILFGSGFRTLVVIFVSDFQKKKSQNVLRLIASTTHRLTRFLFHSFAHSDNHPSNQLTN